MAQDDIPRAFSPFRQLEGSHSRKLKGAGLGFSLIKAMVDPHAGALQVDSQVGVGTTVTARFPARRMISR